MRVTVIEPDDKTELIERYTDAVARIIVNKIPPGQLDTFVKRLKEELL